MRIVITLDLNDSDEKLYKTELAGKALVAHAALLLRQQYREIGDPGLVELHGEQVTPWATITWAGVP